MCKVLACMTLDYIALSHSTTVSCWWTRPGFPVSMTLAGQGSFKHLNAYLYTCLCLSHGDSVNVRDYYQICRTCPARFWNVWQSVKALPDILSWVVNAEEMSGRQNKSCQTFSGSKMSNRDSNVWQRSKCLPDILSGTPKIILIITEMW